MVNRGRELPGGSVDLVVTAMEDQVAPELISMLIPCYQHIVDLSLKSAFFHPPMMIRRCGARSVASLGTEMPSPGLRLTHCPAFKETMQLRCTLSKTYIQRVSSHKILTCFRPAARLFLPLTHRRMLLLCRSRWLWWVLAIQN